MNEIFHMSDIIPLIGLPYPPSDRSAYNIPCPCCDTGMGKKHLNINLKKDVFRCPRCGFSGGVFDLYAFYENIERGEVRENLKARLSHPMNAKKRTVYVAEKAVEENPIADIQSRHQVYTAFLEMLSLASDHRDNLNQRGLTDAVIKKLGYKTTPVVGMTVIAKRLISKGLCLSGIPGFYKNDSGQWTFIYENRGILIPVRDIAGRIQGLQIRRDNVSRRKFRWVSSIGKPEGCKAESWSHMVGPVRSMIILTEGPMKADVIHYLTGQTVVAVPGVNTLAHLRHMLMDLKKLGLIKIMTAFDMDFLCNPHVQSGYQNLVQMLDDIEVEFGTYLWDSEFKGLDDYVWHLNNSL